MPTPSERLLYWLVRRMYRRTELGHTAEMRDAMSQAEKYGTYRSAQVDRVLAAAARLGVPLAGRDVLDLGCSDGAMTVRYAEVGPRRVIGVDIDAAAVEKARTARPHPAVSYLVGDVDRLPVGDEAVDAIVCFDVLEHVTQPTAILAECRRVLRPGGRMLVGTWGWYHPYAPHLWAVMPVPWAHVVFSERTIMRTCRRVFESPWYVPNMTDLDESGRKRATKYTEEVIPTTYVNKLMIYDFEREFAASGMEARVRLEPFSSRLAQWTRVFLRTPYLREFFTGYVWAVLRKPDAGPGPAAPHLPRKSGRTPPTVHTA